MTETLDSTHGNPMLTKKACACDADDEYEKAWDVVVETNCRD